MLFFIAITQAFAQEIDRVPDVSSSDLILLFSVASLVVVGLLLYLLRHSILKKKTAYDEKDYASKKDHDYEKYHSDWTSEDADFGKRSMSDEEFRKRLQDSSLPDYYAILGVPKNATQTEIKSQFRKLAKEMHPDKSKDPKSKDRMAEINMAYEILSDKEKKKSYDKYYNVS